MNQYGNWFLKFDVEIVHGRPNEVKNIGTRAIEIPLTVEASNVSNASIIANTADILWSQLTRQMLVGFLGKDISPQDEVIVKSPCLVFESKPDSGKRRKI